MSRARTRAHRGAAQMRESFTTSATRSESILSARAESLVAEIHFTVSPITALSSFKNPSAVPVQVSALPRERQQDKQSHLAKPVENTFPRYCAETTRSVPEP